MSLEALFQPFALKTLTLANRVVMAPMTRSFSPGGVATEDVAAYYRRRAESGVGLIISEGTGVARPASLNDPDVPRFHGEAELAAWKRVIDEVHAAGQWVGDFSLLAGNGGGFRSSELRRRGWRRRCSHAGAGHEQGAKRQAGTHESHLRWRGLAIGSSGGGA